MCVVFSRFFVICHHSSLIIIFRHHTTMAEFVPSWQYAAEYAEEPFLPIIAPLFIDGFGMPVFMGPYGFPVDIYGMPYLGPLPFDPYYDGAVYYPAQPNY